MLYAEADQRVIVGYLFIVQPLARKLAFVHFMAKTVYSRPVGEQ